MRRASDDQAAQEFRRAADFDPMNPFPQMGLGLIAAAAAYQRASDLVRQQIADKPHDLDLRTRHALYLVKMGKTKEALAEIEEAKRWRRRS